VTGKKRAATFFAAKSDEKMRRVGYLRNLPARSRLFEPNNDLAWPRVAETGAGHALDGLGIGSRSFN
jgi:hypothetical protein